MLGHFLGTVQSIPVTLFIVTALVAKSISKVIRAVFLIKGTVGRERTVSLLFKPSYATQGYSSLVHYHLLRERSTRYFGFVWDSLKYIYTQLVLKLDTGNNVLAGNDEGTEGL